MSSEVESPLTLRSRVNRTGARVHCRSAVVLMRAKTGRSAQLVLANLLEEGLLALHEVLLDGQFMLRVLGVEIAQLLNELRRDRTVRIRELIARSGGRRTQCECKADLPKQWPC